MTAFVLATESGPRQLIMVKLYIIAGESSGDGHAAVLMSELLAIAPDIEFYGDRKSTRLNSSHRSLSRMPSSA